LNYLSIDIFYFFTVFKFFGGTGGFTPGGIGGIPGGTTPVGTPTPAGGIPGAPAGTAGLFGIACLIMKKSATKIIIIKITIAAGLLFFWSAIIHPLSIKKRILFLIIKTQI
jgi:hypothetical protein